MKKAVKKQKEEEEISELNRAIWGIIDGVNCLDSGLTYDEAIERLNAKPDFKGTIVTDTVAARLPRL